MNKKILVCASIAGLLLPMCVEAKEVGRATIEFNSEDTVKVGDTFKVQMSVKDIYDTYNGVVALGGKLSFDNEKIEYLGAEEVDAPYAFEINDKNDSFMLAGLDYTLDNGITGNVTIYEFTFKALVSGNTTITLEEPETTDSTAILNTTVIAKDIKLVANEEVKQVETIKVVETPITLEVKEDKIIEPIKMEIENKEVVITTTKEEKTTVKSYIKKVVSNLILNIKKFFK